MNIRAAIVDDNFDDAQNLYEQFKRYTGRKSAVAEIFCGGIEFLENFIAGAYGVIFLDIIMGRSNGVEIAKKIRLLDNKVKIIFTTTSPEFALESYDVYAAGYMIKPIVYERLKKVLDRFLAESEFKDREYVIKNKKEVRHISYNDIEYIESRNTSIYINLTNGESIRNYGKLSTLMENLHDERFLRCHQSYIINMNYIQTVNDVFCMKSGARIPIRVHEMKKLREIYFDYVIRKAEEDK